MKYINLPCFKKSLCKYILLLCDLIMIQSIDGVKAQELFSSQLIDNGTRLPISYAYIKSHGNNLIVISDQDGHFVLPITKNDTIEISHISYRRTTIPLEKVRNEKVIILYELPIETNPIIISARNAELTVKRAIDSTYKSLNIPLFFICYRKDQIYFNDSLLVEADVELFYDTRILGSASKGALVRSYLRNIFVFTPTPLENSKLPNFSTPVIFAPINMFLAGVSKRDDKYVYFSFQNADDSIIIVGFKPRNSYIPKDTQLIKEGRFIINKNTWKFIRIDARINPETLRIGRQNLSKLKDPKKFYYQYAHSQYFNYEGLPTRAIFEFKFSYQEDNPDRLWVNYSEFLMEKENDNSLLPINIPHIKQDTSFLKMKSSYDSQFKQRFNKRFQGSIIKL